MNYAEESLRLLRSGAVDMCFVNLPITDTEDLEVLPCIEIHDVLKNNDAYHALEKTGGLVVTGPTGTNVNDVAVVLLDG